MKENIKRFTDYLSALGIDKVGHTKGTFLAHLVGVYRLMEVNGCDKEVCLGGMFHSIYGTEIFQNFSLPLERRPEIQALIGERAERLAYLNSALDRPSFDRALESASEPHRIRDRFTGEEIPLSREDFDDLCRVHLYDWLEQVARSSLGWGYRREAYRDMAQRLGRPAQAAYERHFEDEPTPGGVKENALSGIGGVARVPAKRRSNHTKGRTSMFTPFNVWQMFILARHRLLRVYFDQGKLYLVRIGGQLAHAPDRKIVATGPVGLAAGTLVNWLASNERIMSPERLAELDRSTPGDVCGQHKHDLVVTLDDVVEAVVEPWSFFTGLGTYLAQWRLRLADGKKLAFQITEAADLKAALKALPEIFGDRIRVKVIWDNLRQKVVRV